MVLKDVLIMASNFVVVFEIVLLYLFLLFFTTFMIDGIRFLLDESKTLFISFMWAFTVLTSILLSILLVSYLMASNGILL